MQPENYPAFKEKCNRSWNQVHEKLFGSDVPQEKVWSRLEDIVQILNLISANQIANHIYLPDNGWANLKVANISIEPGCIELDCSKIFVVKPHILVFEGFNGSNEWNYFRLITKAIEPSGAYREEWYADPIHVRETVQQVASLRYAHENDHKLERLGEEFIGKARLVNRYFRGGDFVIFSSVSPYDKNPQSDEALHIHLGDKGFRAFILEQLLKHNYTTPTA